MFGKEDVIGKEDGIEDVTAACKGVIPPQRVCDNVFPPGGHEDCGLLLTDIGEGEYRCPSGPPEYRTRCRRGRGCIRGVCRIRLERLLEVAVRLLV